MAEDRRIRFTKSVLKSSLIELMQEKPLAKITVKELCEKADINRGTFYAHYKAPEDLMESMRDELATGIEEHVQQNLSRHERLQGIHALEKALEYIAANQKLCKALSRDPGNTAYWQRFIERIYKMYLSNWLVTISDSPWNDYVYYFMTSGCLSVILRWIGNGCDATPREIGRIVINFTDRGMSYFSE